MSNKLIETIKYVVNLMEKDFMRAGDTPIVKEREKIYTTLYRIAPIESIQDIPVVFVDSGFHSIETDVSSLLLVKVAGLVRREDGRLTTINQLAEYPYSEAYIIYSRWLEKEKPEYVLNIFPLEENSLLFNEERAEKASGHITNLLNQSIRYDIKGTRLVRIFKKIVKYITSQLEIAYAIKAANLVGRNSVTVVDGSLARWFPFEYARFINVEGLDILNILTDLDKKTLNNILLGNFAGLVKTVKFTTIARARWLFKNSGITNPLGYYSYVTGDSVEEARVLLNNFAARYGREAAVDTISLFNRFTFIKSNTWTIRFPFTMDGDYIMHLDIYSPQPLLEYNDQENNVEANQDIASKLAEKITYLISNITAYRSTYRGNPPRGFMEVDKYARIGYKLYHKIEDLFTQIIRSEIKTQGHPLEYLFGTTRRMRIGYR